MNRSYRSIYNPILGAWVAVSEITRARGRRAGGKAVLAMALTAGAWSCAGAQSLLHWDIDGALPGAGSASPSGVWSTSNSNWSVSPAGDVAATPWLDGSQAIFAAGADAKGSYAVTLGSDVTVTGLRYQGGDANSVLSILPGGANTLVLGGATPPVVDVAAGTTLDIQAVIGGAAGLHKSGDGTLVLTGANTYAGDTLVDGGTLAIAGDAQLGAASGNLGLANGATLRPLGNDIAIGRDVTLGTGGGAIDVQGTFGMSLTGTISGSGGLVLVNTAPFDFAQTPRLTLSGNNTYDGGTRIGAAAVNTDRMAVVATGAGNLGTGAVDIYRNSELLFDGSAASAGSLSITTQESTNVKGSNSGVRFVNGASAGSAHMISTGPGSYVIFDGANTTAGSSQIESQGGRINFYGTSSGGSASIDNQGGLMDLAEGSDLSGATVLNSGTVFISNATTGIRIGSLSGSGDAVLGAKTLSLGALGSDDVIGGQISDEGVSYLDGNNSPYVDAGTATGGSLVKEGTGTLTLTGDSRYTGTTTVNAGTLRIEGNNSAASGAITVNAGGTLSSGAGGATASAIEVRDMGTLAGNGTMAGAVTVQSGGHLAPGSGGAGTLSVGSLALSSGALLDFELGQAGTPGGPLNDLVRVAGNLTLDGTLNVAQSSGGSFSPGLYRLFDYGGALTDNGLAFGNVPGAPSDLYVQTSVASQVNLVNSAGRTLNFWDGGNPANGNNNQVDGGNGVWRLGAPDDRWTEATGAANMPWTPNAFAIFQGAPGTVTVDNAKGDVTFSGAQFFVDGYRITGDTLRTDTPETIIRVGDSTAAGAAFTATIDASIAGSGGLVKDDLGTLALAGANGYTGGTTLKNGTLLANNDLALGTGALTIQGGTLGSQTNATLANAVVATGDFNVATSGSGAPSLTLTGDVDLSTPAKITQLTPGTVDFAGAIGGQALTLDATAGAGSFLFSGAKSNGYAGTTTVQGSARLALARTSGAIAVPGDLTVADQGQVLIQESEQIADAAALTIGSDARVAFAAPGKTETIGALFGAGAVDLAGSKLVVGAGDFTGRMGDGAAPGGELEKTGTGTLTLSGANTYSGSTTVTAGTLRAGAAQAFSPASAHSVAAGATLDTGGFNQSVASLANSGTVSLVGSAPGSELTVTGAYVGHNGTLRLATVLNATGPSDRLVLDGAAASASGQTTVQISNVGGLGALTSGSGIEVVAARNGATTAPAAFALAGGHVDAGAFEYQLFDADENGAGESWYLRSHAMPGPVGPGVLTTEPQPRYRAEVPLFAALPAQLRQADQAMLGNLHRRVGDDAAGAPALDIGARRAWGRLIGADLNVRQEGTVSPHSTGHLDGFQVGTDLFALPASPWRAGIYVGQMDGDAKVSGLARDGWGPVGRADLRSQYLGAYATYVSPEGFYADGVLQAGRHRYTLDPTGNAQVSGRGHGVQASIEVGQSFRLGDSWRIEPQAQLVHQQMHLGDVNLGATRVHSDADSGWLARAGLRLKGSFATGIGQLQPYGRVNLYYATGGTDKVGFATPTASTAIATEAGYSAAEVAGGLTLDVTPRVSLYGELGRVFDIGGKSQVKSSVQGSIGARVRW